MVFGGLILGVIAIFLPPLPVVLRKGCGADLLINILLCFLAWIPGVLHAWYVIIKSPGHKERRRIEHRSHNAHHGHHGHHGHHASRGYAPAAPRSMAQQGYYPSQSTGYAPARKY